jgi:putative PEP-CTERM system histidine kinase
MAFPVQLFNWLAAAAAALLAVAAFVRNWRAPSARWFAFGMATLSVDAAFEALSLHARSVNAVGEWQFFALVARSFGPFCWLSFSLFYSRGSTSETLRAWRPALGVAALLPLLPLLLQGGIITIIEGENLPSHFWIHFNAGAKILNGFLLVFPVFVLMNLERTFRAAVGTTRWRIKFVLIGIAITFAASFYTRSQAMIFSGQKLGLMNLETAALLVGCVFVVAGYIRGGFSEIDLYPSREVLQVSLTVLLAGGYLFVVGIMAPIVARFGAAGLFPLAALFVLVAIVLLTLLLLSERVRHKTRLFVTRHFHRPQHDFRKIWTRLTRAVAPVTEENQLYAVVCRLVSETFGVLSVSIWRFEAARGCLVRVASTAEGALGESGAKYSEVSAPGLGRIDAARLKQPFDLEYATESWAQSLRAEVEGCFRTGGHRFCVPLSTSERPIGVMLLADRVGAAPFTGEELDLLACIGDQVAASLTNLRLVRETAATREMAAFQTMSTFFIHDLKNMAFSLGLMLQNVPVHFDDPEFRQDMLRGIGKAAGRINQLINTLSDFRHELHLSMAETDLNDVVRQALAHLNGSAEPKPNTILAPVPLITGDPAKLQSVVTNLILNARDAAGPNGTIVVETRVNDGSVSLVVSDNGVGMSQSFIAESLFKPFKTTKPNGLGIGMFQTRMIVEAHGGAIEVHSTPGSGTVFEVKVPILKDR